MDTPGAIEQPLTIGAFSVRDGRVFVADAVLPVVFEVDATSGEVLNAFPWTLSEAHRGRSTVTDLVVGQTEVLVSSPAAGGLVRIARVEGDVTVAPLPWPPGRVFLDPVDEAVAWVVADPNWAEDRDVQDASATSEMFHPTEHRYVTTEERAPRSDQGGFWAVTTEDGWELLTPAEMRDAAVPEFDEDDDDVEEFGDEAEEFDDGFRADRVEEPTPVWRVVGADPVPMDFRGVVVAAQAADGVLVASVWLPVNPLIEIHDGGMTSLRYPSTLVALTAGGEVRHVADLDDDESRLFRDEDGVLYVCRTQQLTEDRPDRQVWRFEPDRSELVGPIMGSLLQPVAVQRGCVVDLAWPPHDPSSHGPAEEPGRLLRLIALQDERSVEIPIPQVDSDTVTVDGSRVWLQPDDGSSRLVTVAIPTGLPAELVLEIDCTPWRPAATPPEGLSPEDFEQHCLENMRHGLLPREPPGPSLTLSPDENAEKRGYDMRCRTITKHGTFPDTSIEATFTNSARPNETFGWRWRLYDDLGNPQDLEDVSFDLAEFLGSRGLPAQDTITIDPNGIIWLHTLW